MSKPRDLPRRPDGRPVDFGPGLPSRGAGAAYQGREGGEGEDSDIWPEGDRRPGETERPA